MALIKSTILAAISGSINGTTFSRNGGGAYARNRSIPTNPGTDRQDNVRTSLASLAQAWRDTLTDTQRALWINYGASQSVTNRLGDTIKLSGIAAFQRVNLFRLSTLATSMLTEPPASGLNPNPAPTFVGATVTQVSASPPELNVDLANAPATGYSFAYYYSGPISPGIKFYRGPYLAHSTNAITGNTEVLGLTALGDTGASAGMKVAAKLTCYDTASTLPVWTVYIDPITLPTVTP